MVVVLVLVMEVDGVGDGIVGEGMGGSGSGWGQGGGGASWEVQDASGNDLNIIVVCIEVDYRVRGRWEQIWFFDY